MTSEQHVLVRKTFARVLPFSAEAARYFYAALFELDPSLRPLFPTETEMQGRKLMQTLAVIVKSADRLAAIHPELVRLAERHARYGVSEDAFGTVQEALIMTLRKFAGEHFSPEAEVAWRTMYETVAQVMRPVVRERALHSRAESA
jgi:hemoglobin-like flavoprotein